MMGHRYQIGGVPDVPTHDPRRERGRQRLCCGRLMCGRCELGSKRSTSVTATWRRVSGNSASGLTASRPATRTRVTGGIASDPSSSGRCAHVRAERLHFSVRTPGRGDLSSQLCMTVSMPRPAPLPRDRPRRAAGPIQVLLARRRDRSGRARQGGHVVTGVGLDGLGLAVVRRKGLRCKLPICLTTTFLALALPARIGCGARLGRSGSVAH